MTLENPTLQTPAVMLLLSTHCTHCQVALQTLTAMVKQGDIAQLKVINLEQSPGMAEKMGVRSVPWMQIGDFVFEGEQTPQAINDWIKKAGTERGERQYLQQNLTDGNITEVIHYIRSKPPAIKVVTDFMADEDAKINLKLGIGVVLEEFATDPVIGDALPVLQQFLSHNDARVRADACHYLSLTGRDEYIPEIEKCLRDEDAEVREIAQESLAAIQSPGV